MTLSTASRQRLGKLGMLAFLCALPFLVSIVYLERQVERIDTLPVDEYKDLTWTPDGRSLLFLHRPLKDDAQTELWMGEGSGAFESLAHLPAGPSWRLTSHFVDDAIVLGATDQGEETLALLSDGTPSFLALESDWALLPSQGEGLFFSKVVDDVPFEQMAEVEDAPEVSAVETDAPKEPSTSQTPSIPFRSGVQVGRYSRELKAPELVLTIPFDSPEERPEILLARESPDRRFLALVTRFGESSSAGLWVYDSEGSRLLWTRIITDASVKGVDWSPSSVALALCDEKGVVILDNVMHIESTRYEAQALGAVTPQFSKDGILYLIGESSVHRLDRQAGQIETVLSGQSYEFAIEDLIVDGSVSKAAYFASRQGRLELEVCNLANKDEEPTVSELPGSLRRQAQGTLSYQVGDALRTAWRFWRG